jgi:hypothetical protein
MIFQNEPRSRTRLLAVATVLAVVLAGAAAAVAQLGREAAEQPDRTNAGDWAGTWYFVTRDTRTALWIREDGKKPELRIQYMNTSRAESFITDWDCKATYRFHNKPGLFSFEITERDENTIRGKWRWDLGQGELRRSETAWVTLYRTGDGRTLIMNFEDLERFHGGMIGSYIAYQQVWAFRKASNHQRRWEELPF